MLFMVLCHQSTFGETITFGEKIMVLFWLFFVNLFQMFQTQASRRHCTRNIARPKSAPSLSSCNFYLISPGRRDTVEAIFRNIQSLLSFSNISISKNQSNGDNHKKGKRTMKQACQFFFLANGLPKSFL